MEENKLFVPVYHELVDKMKAGIRSGDLSGKLPGVRVLGRQFGVNPATISKALRVLEEKGYVSIIPNSGAFVIPRGNTISNHTIGVICIRRSGEEEVTEQRYLNSRYHYSPYTVSQIAAEIDGEAARAGFHAILVHIGAEQLRQNPAYLTTLPVDGMIFIFSSLTYEIADVLKKKHIPFISANGCYGISEVNYIDFNMAQGIGDFLDELRERGYTRIGYFGPPGKYGFNERVYNIFRKKLGPLFRPHLFAAEAESFDLEFSREDESPEARARALIGTPGELPEVILCNADLADPLEKTIRDLGIRVPEEIQLALITIDPKQSTPGVAGDAPELFRCVTRRLLTIIREEDDSVIQQWLPVRVRLPEKPARLNMQIKTLMAQ